MDGPRGALSVNPKSELVLVTGGAGFIGSHLCEALLECGYNVRVLDNFSQGRREWLPAAVEVIEGDVCDLTACDSAMQGVQGVFHCAAMSRSAASLDAPEVCNSSNVTGTLNVLRAARRAGVRKLVYSGSSTYYGDQPTPHSEEGPGDFLNFYGFTKYAGEEYCRMYDRLYDLPSVVLRYFNVYGPRQPEEGIYNLVIGAFVRRRQLGLPLCIHGDGSQRRDVVHVRDVARANILALESDQRGQTFNVGSGQSVSVQELADMISPLQERGPRRAADSLETLADTRRAQTLLGFQASISLQQGLQELLSPAAS